MWEGAVHEVWRSRHNLFFMKENGENTFSFMQRSNGLVSSQITVTENVLIILILAGNVVHVSEERALLGF